MKIFDKRPLSLILCITLGAFVFFTFYNGTATRTALITSAIFMFAISYFKGLTACRILLRILSVSCVIAALFSYLYFDLYFRAYDRYEGESTITGTIEEIDNKTYANAVLISTEDINNTSFSDYNIIVYLDRDEYRNYSIGTRVKVKGVIENFGAGEDFDAESYYTSRGISGIVNEVSDFEILDNGDFTFGYKLRSFRESICRRIIILSDKDTGGLLSALLLGEKDYLPIGTKLDFSRIGISHILALSGLHLAILAIGFSKLLRFFRISKITATICTILFTLLYMTLTGFSVSVVRAGLMLIVSSLLYLLQRTKDPMTSLFTAVFIICVIEPYSVYDMSLWLSAFATLGIVAMSDAKILNIKIPFIGYVVNSMLASFFAISATFVFTALKFDGISIIAPLSTLIFSLICEVFIYIGILLVLFGGFLPVKYIFTPIGDLIISLADRLSDIDGIYTSTNFSLVQAAVLIFTLLFFVFLIFEVKRRKTALVILASLFVSIFAVSFFMTRAKENATSMVYHSDDDHIILTDSGSIAAIDITNYTKSTAYSMYADMASNDLTRIDKYVITHYSYYLPEAVSTLADSILIREIYIPLPKSKKEETVLFQIDDYCKSADISLTVFTDEDVISVGEASVIPLYNHKLGGQKKNLITVFYEDEFYTYASVDILKGETKNMALEVLGGSRAVIFGCHVSGSSQYNFNYKFENLKTLIISDSRIAINESTAEYYSEKDVYISPKKIYLIH